MCYRVQLEIEQHRLEDKSFWLRSDAKLLQTVETSLLVIPRNLSTIFDCGYLTIIHHLTTIGKIRKINRWKEWFNEHLHQPNSKRNQNHCRMSYANSFKEYICRENPITSVKYLSKCFKNGLKEALFVLLIFIPFIPHFFLINIKRDLALPIEFLCSYILKRVFLK